tara:strand:- start:17 stop:346 length:330 start_codon:yes stop_codon:yes gene_type:complete
VTTITDWFDAFRKEITAIPGVRDTLKAQNIPFCVANQGPVFKMQITLGAVWRRARPHNQGPLAKRQRRLGGRSWLRLCQTGGAFRLSRPHHLSELKAEIGLTASQTDRI